MAIDAYYSKISDAGTDLAVFEPGMETGTLRDHKGKTYILLKAAASIADGLVVKKDTTSGDEITVILSAAAADVCLGINNAARTIASGQYFWALRKGMGYGDPEAGGFSDGDRIIAVANGEIDTLAAGGLGKVIGIAIKDSSATVNANKVLFDFPGTGEAAS